MGEGALGKYSPLSTSRESRTGDGSNSCKEMMDLVSMSSGLEGTWDGIFDFRDFWIQELRKSIKIKLVRKEFVNHASILG